MMLKRLAGLTLGLWAVTLAAPALAQPQADPIGALLEAAPARPQLTEPVHIEETGKSPDVPPSARDLAYESRLRSSFASAQSFQGPLDGSWTLAVAGADLYALQLADRGDGVVEGAWRDLRRPGAVAASGFVDQIESQGSDLILRFAPASGAPVEIVLRNGHEAGWSGEIADADGRRAALMRRKIP